MKRRIGLMLRFSTTKLHRKVVEAAEANDRSLNAEIMHRLELSFQIEDIQQAIRDYLYAS